MWVRFQQRYCWEATPAVSIVFKPDGGPFKDGRYLVKRACAAAAIASGKAERVERQKRVVKGRV